MAHIPVLLQEVLEFADPKPGEYFIDATLGNGGHARAILEKILPRGKLLGIDWNEDAIMNIEKKFKREIRMHAVIVEKGNFARIAEIVRRKKFPQPDGIIADLGMSSEELEESGRGFSFKKSEPLLMTYDAHPAPDALTAGKIVNEFSEEALRNIFREFGEERYAGRYARAIVAHRKIRPIRTSRELAAIIERAAPAGTSRIHPATRVFQALRIAVNDELENLRALISDGFNLLDRGGRMVIISYHSLEDRIVKHEFRRRVSAGTAHTLTKKPVRPSARELRQNPRSRSAKLRAIMKI
jgi:16S rRNA (cytosine1402-N4)-methyltransferase